MNFLRLTLDIISFLAALVCVVYLHIIHKLIDGSIRYIMFAQLYGCVLLLFSILQTFRIVNIVTRDYFALYFVLLAVGFIGMNKGIRKTIEEIKARNRHP